MKCSEHGRRLVDNYTFVDKNKFMRVRNKQHGGLGIEIYNKANNGFVEFHLTAKETAALGYILIGCNGGKFCADGIDDVLGQSQREIRKELSGYLEGPCENMNCQYCYPQPETCDCQDEPEADMNTMPDWERQLLEGAQFDESYEAIAKEFQLPIVPPGGTLTLRVIDTRAVRNNIIDRYFNDVASVFGFKR